VEQFKISQPIIRPAHFVIQIIGNSMCEFYVFTNSGPALRPNSQQIKVPGAASTGISGSGSTGFTGGRVSFWSLTPPNNVNS
jgi:hypothetical protein